MQIKDIKTLVARLGAIVDGWDEKSGAPAVERHIAASLLAELYEAVKFDTALAATEVVKVLAEPMPVDEQVGEAESEVAEVIDLSDIFGGSSDDEEEVEQAIVEQTIEEVAEPEPEIEEQSDEEEVAEQPAEIEEQVEEIEEVEEEVESVETEVAKSAETVVEQCAEAAEQLSAIEEEQPTAIEEQPAEAEVEQQPAETVEEQPKSEQASLFDMEIVRRPRSSSGRRVIMSLYGEPAAPAPREKREEKPVEKFVESTSTIEPISPEPIAEPTPTPDVASVDEQTSENVVAEVTVAERIAAAQYDGSQVLGDVIGAGTTTLAEAVAASQPTVHTVQNDRVNSLRNSIGINDRFIMIRDLFGGDGAAFDRAMDELDAFEDFNECLVYMSTYRWNPNSDGARMLMDLVTRKLL